MFAATVVVFISTVGFSRKEMVRGRLRPTTSEAHVFAESAGILVDVRTRLGDRVTAEQVLARVATNLQLDDDSSLAVASLEVIARDREILESRRATLIQASTLQQNAVRVQLEALTASRVSAEQSEELTQRRVQIAEDRLEISQRLSKEGAASAEEGRAREDQLIVQRQQLVDLNSRLAQMRSQQKTLEIELGTIETTLAIELAGVDQQLSALQAQHLQAQARAGHVIKAPIAGRVAALQATVGERIDPTRPLLTLLPENTELVAEVYVPSRAIAFVEPGQGVRIQYDAFPYQKFGAASGEVLEVSATALSPQELRAPVATTEPVYRVTISLSRQSMKTLNREIVLQAGMELSADIVLEDRRLLDWVLEPLYAANSRM